MKSGDEQSNIINDNSRLNMNKIYRFFINFDEGMVITVSKTGLAWSILMYFIAYDYLRFHANPNEYRESLWGILKIWPIIVLCTGLGIGLMINIYYNGNVRLVERGIKFASGIFLVGGMLIFLIFALF